jgi:hypothetical protein
MTASALRSGIRNGQFVRWPGRANVLSHETALMLTVFCRLPIVFGRLAAARSRRYAE